MTPDDAFGESGVKYEGMKKRQNEMAIRSIAYFICRFKKKERVSKMKQGKEHYDFLTELKEHKFNKRDFIADTRRVQVLVKEKSPVNLGLTLPDVQTVDEVNADAAPVPAVFDLNRLAISQICTKLKIPFRYAERLFVNYPDLLAHQINALFSREPKKQMVRTLGENVRAFLSDKYRRIDNFDVAVELMPVIEGILGVDWRQAVRSCEVTESRMYIKIVHPTLEAKIPMPEGYQMGVGHQFFVDRVQAGIKISNSEVGLGRVLVSPAIYTHRCTNYATFERDNFAAVHLGRRQGEGVDVTELYSDQTKALDDAAIFGKIKDVTKAALDGTLFGKHVAMLTEARGDEIPENVNPVKVVEVLKDEKNFTESEADAIINNLIKGGELTRYGLHAAITRAAETIEDYDRATEFEQLGGEIIELAPTEWHAITKKAA